MNGSVELTNLLPHQRSNMDHLPNTQFSELISSQSPGTPPVIPGNCYLYLPNAESAFTGREARINSMISLINIPLCNSGSHITNTSFSSGIYNSGYASQINWNGESVQGTLEYDFENVNSGKFQDLLECGSDTVLNSDVPGLLNGSWGQILDGMILTNSQSKV
jgi:hypothetical protein